VYARESCIHVRLNAVCCTVLHCVAVCCSLLQCVVHTRESCIPHTATHCNALQVYARWLCVQHTHCMHDDSASYAASLQICCSVLQCIAVCCSVLQCVAVCYSVLQCVAVCWRSSLISRKTTMCVVCSVLQCVAVCCSVFQFVPVCSSKLEELF